jgi:integrase
MPLSAAKQNELHQREALLQFESVKRWFTCETIRAGSTKRGYLKYLAILVNHLNCTPDELVAQRIADMAQRDFAKRERLEQIVRELKREVSREGESKACMFVTAICSFMKANTGARLNTNNPLAEITHEVWMYEGEPSREQDFWRKIVDHAPNIRDAAVFLIGLEAGPRDGSLLRMTVGDVTSEFSGGAAPYKLVVPPPGESPMKKRGGFNFIAEDAKTKINAYLALRRARFGEYQAADQFLVDLETGQPLKGFDTINEALRKRSWTRVRRVTTKSIRPTCACHLCVGIVSVSERRPSCLIVFKELQGDSESIADR